MPLESRPEDALIHAPETLLEPLPVDALFAGRAPLEVELGSGDGSFLVECARRHPERHFLGVERLLGRLRKTARKGRRARVENLRLIRIEARYFLEYLLPRHAANALHVYFPDPWPKRKHWRHRLVDDRFREAVWQGLAPSGALFFRTDDREYFDQMIEVFRADPRFVTIQTPDTLATILTDFERDYLAQGRTVHHTAYRRIP